MNDKEYMKLAIELSKKAYYPYGATLEDSKECVNDILAHANDVANVCKNRKISITPECERDEAVKVLKKWKENN